MTPNVGNTTIEVLHNNFLAITRGKSHCSYRGQISTSVFPVIKFVLKKFVQTLTREAIEVILFYQSLANFKIF